MGDESKQLPFDPYTYEGSPAVEVKHGLFMMVFSSVLFYGVNYLLVRNGIPSKITGDVWRWRNTFVSCIHAAIVGTGVLYCLMFKNFTQDPVLYCDQFSYLLVPFCIGYFIYDFYDYLSNNKLLKHYEIGIHHICAIWCFSYATIYRLYIGYALYGLMTEINSVFLHARKVMQMSQWPRDYWLYRLVIFLNFFTFICFRLVGIFACLIGLVVEVKRTTVTFLSLMLLVVTAMLIINPILLWRLIKSDILRRSKQMKVEMNGNNNLYIGNVTDKSS